MRLHDMNIDFVRYRKPMGYMSIALAILSVVGLSLFGLSLGLDFSGGVLVELHFGDPVSTDNIKQTLAAVGIDNVVVQFFGTSQDIIVRLPESNDQDLSDKVFTVISEQFNNVELRRVEFVGAQVGEELRDQGGLGLIVALAVVLIYVAFRFQIKFALGSVIALVHDVLIILGFFSWYGLDFDLSVLAALLAIVGYSLNDSIVVSDRIRENFFKRNFKTLEEIVNRSLNEVMGRTIITSLTTMMVVVALLLFGGEAIRPFALALFVGIIVGTYSSIYIVCNLLFMLSLKREDMLVDDRSSSEKEVV